VNDAQAFDLLEELLRIESLSTKEQCAVQFLVERGAALGFESSIDAVGNAVLAIGDRGPRVVLLGHVDTVPGHVPVRREGELLFGRGAVDAKGPLVAFIAAAHRAASDGSLACRVEIVACVEEEIASSRGAHYRATLPAPDFCVVGEPSGSTSVTVGYKGHVELALAHTRPLEHTAAASRGALAHACRTWTALEDALAAHDEQHVTNRESWFERIQPHLAALEHRSDGLHEHTHLTARLRLPPTLSPAAARDLVAHHAHLFTVTANHCIPAWETSRTSPLARALARAITRTATERGPSDVRPRFVRKTGTADTNVLAQRWPCPMVAYGPGDSSLDHTPNEHVAFTEFAIGVGVMYVVAAHLPQT
jgi:LysW-gamma-L-lysine carboxypeptidase